MAGEQSPFVGRERELRILVTRHQEAVASTTPRTVLVVGEAGVGKSRLIGEFLAAVGARAPDVPILQARCPPSGTGSAYWPLAELVREATGVPLGDDAGRAAAALRRHLRRHVSARPALADLVHALAATAGLRVARNPLDDAEPRAVDAAIRQAWPRYVAVRANAGGLVLVIEDVHWADPQLLRVIEAIHQQTSGAVLTILSTRPGLAEREPGFATAREAWTLLALAPLEAAESERLVRELLRAPDLAGSLARVVAARAEGNPLHIEEAIRLLADIGALEGGGDVVRVVDTARVLASPASIAGLLTARVEALPADERRVLQAAAIVGRRFWDGAVSAAVGDRAVPRHLSALEDRGLVGRRGTSSLGRPREYVFKHALIRDAAYDSMPRGRRARAHAAVGTWLEAIAKERLAEVDEFVAEHYRRAVEEGDAAGIWAAHADEREQLRVRAFRRLVSAGAAARQRYALDRAVELHAHAVQLATAPAERAEALEELGEDHETGLRGEEAMESYLGALTDARSPGVPAERRAQICMKAARTLVLRWGAFPSRPDPVLMDQLLDEGMAATSDPVTRCWLLALAGGAAIRWHSDVQAPDPVPFDERIRRTRLALDEAARIGQPDLAGFAARIVGQLQFEDRRFVESRETMRSVRPLLSRMHSKFQRALTSMYVFLAVADVEGRYEDALALAAEMLELGREMSAHERMHGTFGQLWALHHLGRWSEMGAIGEEHLEALRGEDQMVCPYVRSGPLVWALTLAYLGDGQAVDRITSQIKPTWDEPGLPEILLSRIAIARGRHAEGRRLAEGILASGRSPSLEENAFDRIAFIEALVALEDWSALGDAVLDARQWEPALALMKPYCDRADGLAALAAGNRGAGITRLRSADSHFGRLKLRYEVARTKALLAQAMPNSSGLLTAAIESAEPLLAGTVSGTAPAALSVAAQERLTDREMEVLTRVAEGLDNDGIAGELAISVRTVERHLSNLYAKLGVGGKSARAAATARAYEANLIGRPPD